MTILLADSGSTKTDWGLVENGKLTKKLRTSGMNPFQMSEEAITEEIKTHLVPELPSTTVDEVHFYGAGCTKEKQPVVERALRANLTITNECEVASDMLGAARGICGHKPGIACILGTGSNSCSYDGKQLVKNVSPLGFILGDEGSGAVLGRRLVGDVLKGQLPRTLREDFEASYGLTADEIIRRVYREPLPNRFLASFAPFLHRHRHEAPVAALLGEEFDRFFARNVAAYARPDLPVGFVGSIAHFFRAEVAASAARFGLRLGPVLRAPL